MIQEDIKMNLKDLQETYAAVNPASRQAYEDALGTIPGGITANVKYFAPFPLFFKEGHGAYLTDLDQHRYVDYVLSYGPLILGHGRKEIIDAMNEYLDQHGTILYGAPHPGELQFAKLIQKYYPSIEELRYTNSGTEATLFAIRTAFAYTGKYKIAKFEGHYHGGYNEVLISVNPDVSKAGEAARPVGLPESRGISEQTLHDTIVLPFNNLTACREILTEHQDEIAGVIMEPCFGGTIPATKEFMAGIRKLTKELGILMIMDEVKTGFRVSMQGAQGYYGVKPDLTTLGKVIGAGLPIGILGGRRDILEMAAPQGSDLLGIRTGKSNAADVLYHSGTYNGHPLILHMGASTIHILANEFDGMLKRTERLKKGITDIYAKHGVHILTPGIGCMFNVCVTDLDRILTYRDLQKSDFELRQKLDYALLCNGVYNKPGNRYNMCTAHTDDVIDFTLEAYEKAFEMI